MQQLNRFNAKKAILWIIIPVIIIIFVLSLIGSLTKANEYVSEKYGLKNKGPVFYFIEDEEMKESIRKELTEHNKTVYFDISIFNPSKLYRFKYFYVGIKNKNPYPTCFYIQFTCENEKGFGICEEFIGSVIKVQYALGIYPFESLFLMPESYGFVRAVSSNFYHVTGSFKANLLVWQLKNTFNVPCPQADNWPFNSSGFGFHLMNQGLDKSCSGTTREKCIDSRIGCSWQNYNSKGKLLNDSKRCIDLSKGDSPFLDNRIELYYIEDFHVQKTK